MIAAAKIGLAAMYPRPTTPKYQELSTALQQAIQESLLGQSSPEDALEVGRRQQRPLSDIAVQAALAPPGSICHNPMN